jgi:hypothetical protein
MAVSDPKALSPGARKQLEWSLLNELASLLEDGHKQVSLLRDDPAHLNTVGRRPPTRGRCCE